MKKRLFNYLSIRQWCIGIGLSCVFTGLQATPDFNISDHVFDVQLSLNNATIKSIVHSLQQQTGIIFSYDTSLERISVNDISVNTENQSIETVLEQVFRGTDIQYKVNGQMVVLYSDKAIATTKNLVAQQTTKTVTGVILDEFGDAVIGANVFLKGTVNGTITSLEGDFSLDVPEDGILVISYIGYTPQEIPVTGKTFFNITLNEDTQKLDEVVVTALGIKREKKALGYATQELKGEDLVSSRESNVTNALSGKVSGLQVVRSSGGPGSSSKIVLRGNSSLTGSNQPLIVIDGVPMDNFTGGVDDFYGNSGMDMGNGLADINPDDIESMNVLKGASAAALYGSRAGNGVILITTKSGKKQTGLGITVNAGLTTETLFLKPKLQNTFGQGELGIYDKKSRYSWGPVADGSQKVENWNGKDIFLKTYDNIGNYFQTGTSFNEGVSFQQSYDGTAVFASINRTDDKGIVPGSKLNRTSFTLRGTTEFGPEKRWKLDGKVNYINNYVKNRPIQGVNQSNAFNTVYNLPRSIDITQLKDCVDENGNMIWWDSERTPQENPYWIKGHRTNEDIRNRMIGSMSLSYNITDWWSMELRGGTDYYATNMTAKVYSGGNVKPKGSYEEGSETFYENNYSFLTTFKKDNVVSKLGGVLTVGGNMMAQRRRKSKIGTSDLLIPDLFAISNAADVLKMVHEYSDVQRKMNSLYGSLQLNWDGWLFMDITGRNDWSSTMSKANQSYFYPSVSVSGVLSDMVRTMGSELPHWITFAKVRGGYAEVGNDLDPHQLYTLYKVEPDPNGNPSSSLGNTLYDANVQSELIKSWEAGIELKFLNNRLGVDAAWYRTNATRQLLNIPMDPFSGYSYQKINAGNIQNEGIELMLYGTILQNSKGLNWESSLNVSRNKNKIIDLYDDITEYGIGTFDDLKIVARTGQYYGEIYGKKFERVQSGEHAGKIIVDNQGLPLLTADTHYLGNQQPDCMLGWTNTFRYNNLSLSFLIDARIGGEIYSATTAYLYRNGNAAGTVVNGKREDFVVGNSVMQNEDGGYSANGTAVSPELYWKRVAGSGNMGLGEAFIYDATNIRLRNITLGYDLEKKWLAKTAFERVRLSFVVNNVWVIMNRLEGIDPEAVSATNSNAVGVENVSAPTSRSFTFNVAVSF